ncbi:MAG: DUF167 domain-containing protein [Candidatus Bathyarchaeota archaeon]|nr:DUF167 domain-containing protein [Candidatus Bathyarchaeota archaeon]
MKLLKTKDGVILEIQVKPKSKNFRIRVNDELVIFCRQQPVKGKVNRELIKELSKIFGRKVEIVSGLRSKVKKILIRKIAEEDVSKILESVRKDNIV